MLFCHLSLLSWMVFYNDLVNVICVTDQFMDHIFELQPKHYPNIGHDTFKDKDIIQLQGCIFTMQLGFGNIVCSYFWFVYWSQ